MQPLTIKQRSAPLAAWINCLAPGLGLYYLGQPGQARLLLLLSALPWFVALLLPQGRYLPMLAIALLISVLCLLSSMIISWHRASASGPVVMSPGQNWAGFGLFWLSSVLLCLLWLALLVVKTGVMPMQVTGNNMAGSIDKYDWVLLEKTPQGPGSVRRGDLVLLTHPDSGRAVLQRVVGLPGERITVHGGGLFIDGHWQSEPYLDPMLNQKNIPEGVVETTVPRDGVFVLADNRDASRDSRYWGALPQQQIEGRVVYHFDRQRLSWQELLAQLTVHSLNP